MGLNGNDSPLVYLFACLIALQRFSGFDSFLGIPKDDTRLIDNDTDTVLNTWDLVGGWELAGSGLLAGYWVGWLGLGLNQV